MRLLIEGLNVTMQVQSRTRLIVPGPVRAALPRLAAGCVLLLLVGCAVPQPRGHGLQRVVVEPTTKRTYLLYLPEEYVNATEQERKARRWPLVVTFHGMKPYDIAWYQAREWEEEADRYGFIVVSPELMAFDFLFGQFPQRTLNRPFKRDGEVILAILDHVFATTEADRNNVLSTGFSSGGYMAHYMINRHPDVFTCLAPRQANFTANVLDPSLVDRSLYHPILIVNTQNDFGICKRESREAIKWYESHGYKNLAWVHINRLGHERTPDVAADFFARVAGVTPNKPPDVLVKRQAIDGNPKGLALLAGKMQSLQRAPGVSAAAPSPRQPARMTERPRAVVSTAARNDRPPQPPAQPNRPPSPLDIRVSSAIGFEPLLLLYSAECPSDWQRTADFYWTLNGENIGRGINGQRTLAEPGDYTLRLLVVTRSGAEHESSRRIRVLRDLNASSASTRGNPG
jgi:predicted esterase